jgi:hypothetical protein
MAINLASRVAAVEANMQEQGSWNEWMEGRMWNAEDRVDRLYHQSRIYTISCQSLEDLWKAEGDAPDPAELARKGAAEVWLCEVARALDVGWPLPKEEPSRDALIFGRSARKAHDALWAIAEEIPTALLRVEGEWRGDLRVEGAFTLVMKLGQQADRIEKWLSGEINQLLMQANRDKGGGKIQAWRARTRAEKRRRQWQRDQAEIQGVEGVAEAGGEVKGKGKGKNNGGKGKKGGKGKDKGKQEKGKGKKGGKAAEEGKAGGKKGGKKGGRGAVAPA